MKLQVPFFLFLILVLLLSLYITYRKNIQIQRFKTGQARPTVIGIMITGKSKCRYLLALKSIENFQEQSYTNKHLIIINHGDKKLNINDDDNITEILVDKKASSLGSLRNAALSLVPTNAYWTLWDDDDYRQPYYIEYLLNQLLLSNSDTILFCNRYDYNWNSNFVFKATLKTGFVTLLSRMKENQNVWYLDRDTMEDLNLIRDLRRHGHKINILYDNDPKLYIRLVHRDNTSLYVRKEKNDIIPQRDNSVYYEERVSDEISKDISNFISDYYRKGLSCMINSEN